MKKSNEITRRQYSDNGQSEFDHRYACWANNHNGWRKMKKLNRKLFKKKIRREIEREIEDFNNQGDNWAYLSKKITEEKTND